MSRRGKYCERCKQRVVLYQTPDGRKVLISGGNISCPKGLFATQPAQEKN
jgi:hypothetical protein